MIKITKNAQKHFIDLLSKQKKGTQIRVFVNNPGEKNAECGVSYCLQNEVDTMDIKLDFKQFYVYVDFNSCDFLKDSEIDIVEDELSSQLTMKAPYARKKTFNNNLIDKINNFLDMEINPNLLSHGGKVFLVNLTKEGYVFLKFTGGCNGCSMINLTLKEGIEKKLLSCFPELKGVKDITNHRYGKHSYL
ncbi:NfuA family Fe-S biogenesis protein [Buchnera aphidicola (Neophyllaphis varicolor)]|uniref:NfuA family Fe-S biogenesis protein n=1 Tax=Buchnera aphidicola TaxID=9 RepID=UPI0031B7F658